MGIAKDLPIEVSKVAKFAAGDAYEGWVVQALKGEAAPKFGLRPIHLACLSGDVAKLSELLARGHDVNQAGYFGWTPLHFAVMGFARSARSYAATNRWESVTALLLLHGADATIYDRCGYMPAMCGRGHTPRALREEMSRLAEAGTWPAVIIDENGTRSATKAGRMYTKSMQRSEKCQ